MGAKAFSAFPKIEVIPKHLMHQDVNTIVPILQYYRVSLISTNLQR